MKQAIFLACYFGIDGLAPKAISFASPDEKERDDWIESQEYPHLFLKEDRVVDLDDVSKTAWNKLNGLERLALAMPDCCLWVDPDLGVSKHCR